MSANKQPKPKRAVPAAKPKPEAVALPAPVPMLPVLSAPLRPAAKPEAVALPAPAPTLPVLPAPLRRRPAIAGDTFLAACRTTLAAIGESQTAIATDVTTMALEMAGLARSNLTAAGEGVTALLGARSFADAMEIQLGLARRSLAAMVDGSTRLRELGLRLANDAAKPILAPFGGI